MSGVNYYRDFDGVSANWSDNSGAPEDSEAARIAYLRHAVVMAPVSATIPQKTIAIERGFLVFVDYPSGLGKEIPGIVRDTSCSLYKVQTTENGGYQTLDSIEGAALRPASISEVFYRVDDDRFSRAASKLVHKHDFPSDGFFVLKDGPGSPAVMRGRLNLKGRLTWENG